MGHLVEDAASRESAACEFGVVNPAYPSSYWMIAYSKDVPFGGAIPVRALERDLVLWRDSEGKLFCHSAFCTHLGAHIGYGGEVVDGCLQCPFHGWTYDSSGTNVGQPGTRPARERLKLVPFQLVEKYGAIFIWNGSGSPDHEFPDFLAMDGLTESDVTYSYMRYHLPFPSEYYAENLPDSAHFAVVHSLGGWGDTEVISESETALTYRVQQFANRPYLSLENLRVLHSRGELFSLLDTRQDMDVTTHGGGLHTLKLCGLGRPVDDKTGWKPLRKMLDLSDRFRLVFSFTPTSPTSHNLQFVMIAKKVGVPLVGPALDWFTGAIWILRGYGGIRQDASVLMFRHEPEQPGFNKFDRALVRYRRFYDRRRVLAKPIGVKYEGSPASQNGAQRAGSVPGGELVESSDEVRA